MSALDIFEDPDRILQYERVTNANADLRLRVDALTQKAKTYEIVQMLNHHGLCMTNDVLKAVRRIPSLNIGTSAAIPRNQGFLILEAGGYDRGNFAVSVYFDGREDPQTDNNNLQTEKKLKFYFGTTLFGDYNNGIRTETDGGTNYDWLTKVVRQRGDAGQQYSVESVLEHLGHYLFGKTDTVVGNLPGIIDI